VDRWFRSTYGARQRSSKEPARITSSLRQDQVAAAHVPAERAGEMSPLDMTSVAHAVVARYPAPLGSGPLVALGNHGGFSGASLWRLGASLCLRASPPSPDPSRLAFAHRLMLAARQDGLHFVPTVFAASDSNTFVDHAGRLWELMNWMPGRASYHESPSRLKLQSACAALGQLHRSWERFAEPWPKSPPVISRRFQIAALGLPDTPPVSSVDPARPIIDRALCLLPSQMQRLPSLFLPWLNKRDRPQPCLCDVWHDHLLFEGDRLTGLVDYAAVKNDHVAVDLARLLGSLVEDDEERWREGLAAYSRQRPLSEEDEALAHMLDITGTILGAVNWVYWLSDPQRTFENRAAAVRRLERLLQRIERWK
jgi:homoserine kinase type II